jgi:hypothetical protein
MLYAAPWSHLPKHLLADCSRKCLDLGECHNPVLSLDGPSLRPFSGFCAQTEVRLNLNPHAVFESAKHGI